jgi:hypothetical protein
MAMAATAAAQGVPQARDATRLEPLVCFFNFFSYYTNLFLGPLNASKKNGNSDDSNSMGSRRIASRLEPLVRYYYYYLFFILY